MCDINGNFSNYSLVPVWDHQIHLQIMKILLEFQISVRDQSAVHIVPNQILKSILIRLYVSHLTSLNLKFLI